MNRRLGPGGRVYVSVPFEHTGIGTNISRVYGRKWYYGDPHFHLLTWTPLNTRSLLVAAGFEGIKCVNIDEVLDSMETPVKLEAGKSKGGPIEKFRCWCTGTKRAR